MTRTVNQHPHTCECCNGQRGARSLYQHALQPAYLRVLQRGRRRSGMTERDLQPAYLRVLQRRAGRCLAGFPALLQPAYLRVLQPPRRCCSASGTAFNPHTCECCNLSVTAYVKCVLPSTRIPASVATAKTHNAGFSCTVYYVHVLTFSSVMRLDQRPRLTHTSRFEDGKSPYSGANLLNI